MNYEAIKLSNDAGSQTAPTIELLEKEIEIEKYASKRIAQMKQYRKDLKIEQEWKDADAEFIPDELPLTAQRKRFETDQETGLRTRLVPIGDTDEDWRSNNSDPVFMVKVQTALSILSGQMPAAKLKAVVRKFEKKTALAYAIWKRNWAVSGSAQVYIKFIFNLAKYGWAPGRTFPLKIAYDKEILTEVDEENPENNVYEKTTNVWFNDVAKEALEPFRVWLDEQSKPYDEYSTQEVYYEKDFSYDEANVEFGKYPNFKKFVPAPRNLRVTFDSPKPQDEEDKEKELRTDIITIGFFESRLKDLYYIRIPAIAAPIHSCAHPNDDGYLSIWHAPWQLRSIGNPYGISLWKIIKQNKTLFDKMKNMTMDQLVLSIMKMFFYTGTNNLIGDGKIKIKPGVGRQMVNGKMDFLEVPGPGAESWQGLEYIKSSIDDDSGITPTLQGSLDGKTLGQTLQAKESALKRLKTPVDNIAWAMQQDAYITLSWSAQTLSTPEMRVFATEQQIQAYEMESGTKHDMIVAQGGAHPETGAPVGPFAASFLPEVSLHLEKDGDNLIESRTDRFFQVGKDIKPSDLRWRGIFEVIPKSIITPLEELEKQSKMQFFNIIVPLLPQPPEPFAKAVAELAKSQDLDPIDWLPDTWMTFLMQEDQKSLFVSAGPLLTPPPGTSLPGSSAPPTVPSNQVSMQGAEATAPNPGGPTVVPQDQLSLPVSPGSTAAPRNELTRS